MCLLSKNPSAPVPGALSLCCLSHLWHAWTSTPLCSYHCSASTQPSGAHDTSPPPSSQDLQKITCTLDTDQLCRHPGWQMGAQTIFSDPNKEFSKWLLQHSFCLSIQVLHDFFTLRLALLYPLVPASSQQLKYFHHSKKHRSLLPVGHD